MISVVSCIHTGGTGQSEFIKQSCERARKEGKQVTICYRMRLYRYQSCVYHLR
jgi:hypothetical protein